MANATINLGTAGDPATNGGVASFSLSYDNQLRATALNGINNMNVGVQCTLVGLGADGNADPVNKTYSMLIPAGQSQTVTIPVSGTGAIQLSANPKNGQPSGFNFSTN